jgi:hypothetical protein
LQNLIIIILRQINRDAERESRRAYREREKGEEDGGVGLRMEAENTK